MHVALGVSRIRFGIPLGPAYLAASLSRAGHRVSLFTFGADADRSLSRLLADPPGLVGCSVLTGEHGACLSFLRRLRGRLAAPSVLGGPHPTFHPGIVLEEGVDAVCLGEGEEALAEMAGRLEREGRLPEDVANFHVRRADGTVAENPPRPLVADLDLLPPPDRALFERAAPHLRRHGVRHFLAHRGCPRKCTYCFNASNHRLYGGSAAVRPRRPDAVCDEVEAVRTASPLRMAAFVEDTFAEDGEWLARFAAEWRRVGLPYSVNLHPATVTETAAGELAASGCRLAYVGIESGSREMRRLLGRTEDVPDALRAVRRLEERGIRVIAENIVGLPGETLGQALETLLRNSEARPSVANCSLFAPYPGLPLSRYAVEKGYFGGDLDRVGENYYHRSALSFPDRRDGRRLTNLRCLFGTLSRFPRLLPAATPLLSLPPNPLFRLLGDVADGYFLSRCLPYRLSPAEWLRTALDYLRVYR